MRLQTFLHSSPHLTHPMTDAIAIHCHEMIDLVATYPDGMRLSQLMGIVVERSGRHVTFLTGSVRGMDLDGLLRLLEARAKMRDC